MFPHLRLLNHRLLPSQTRGLLLAGVVAVSFALTQHVAFAVETTPAPASGTMTNATMSSDVENAVIKVFATVRYPDPYRPWAKQDPTEVTGSGVVIEGKRILTAAHVVLYASQVEVQANQAGDRVSGTVEAIAPAIDLAVIKLDDNAFFDTHHPLPFDQTLPDIKDAVMVYGYPQGGTSLSITKGIVSRIEFSPYNYPVSGLRIQIDAAINQGNSGGPCVADDKMIGLAFSQLGGAENISYVIPCEEIKLFLQDIAQGPYRGKPAMYDELQTLENPALRAFLKLDKTVSGIVVHKPYDSSSSYPLKKWDVITKIGDTPVDDEGMVKLGAHLRVRFQYLVQKIARDGKVPLTVVRDGKEIQIELPVLTNWPQVLPGLEGSYPSYFVFGPLVFSSATTEFANGLLKAKLSATWLSVLTASASPLLTRWGDAPAFDGESLVLVSSPFFPHKLSKGYSNPIAHVIASVNGIPIKNLNHLVEVLRDAKEEFVTIEFVNRRAETLVFSRKEMLDATDEILTDNGIRSQGSPDTLAIWNAKASP